MTRWKEKKRGKKKGVFQRKRARTESVKRQRLRTLDHGQQHQKATYDISIINDSHHYHHHHHYHYHHRITLLPRGGIATARFRCTHRRLPTRTGRSWGPNRRSPSGAPKSRWTGSGAGCNWRRVCSGPLRFPQGTRRRPEMCKPVMILLLGGGGGQTSNMHTHLITIET